MKEYPVTRDELFELGGIGVATTICFSVGGSYMSRSVDIQRDLELSQQLPSDVVVRWQTKEIDYWYFGIAIVFIGVVALALGGAKIFSIMRSTKHSS